MFRKYIKIKSLLPVTVFDNKLLTECWDWEILNRVSSFMFQGYGFVHFETEEAAVNAIQKVNGMLLNDKKVFVGRFVPRKEREKELGEKAKKFTNVYVKNFGEELGDDKLKDMFTKFGKITSYKVVSPPPRPPSLNAYQPGSSVPSSGRISRLSSRVLNIETGICLSTGTSLFKYHGSRLNSCPGLGKYRYQSIFRRYKILGFLAFLEHIFLILGCVFGKFGNFLLN